MQIEKRMNILDLGCGTGSGTIDIASELEGTGKVVGLDLSEKMIEQAKQKLSIRRIKETVPFNKLCEYRDRKDKG